MGSTQQQQQLQMEIDMIMKDLIEKYSVDACQESLRRLLCTTSSHPDTNNTSNSVHVGHNDDEDDDINNKESSSSHLLLANSILEASFDASFITDDEGMIQRINLSAVKMFGYDHRNELIGKNISIVIGGPHAARHTKSEYFASATQSRIDIVLNRMRDVTGKRKDGSEFPVQVGIKIIDMSSTSDDNNNYNSGNNKKRMFVAYCHDLSRHKIQLQKLEEDMDMIVMEQRLNKSILDASFDAIIVTEACSGKIIKINKATLTMFRYENEHSLLGKDIKILVGGNHAEQHTNYMKRFHDRGGTNRVLGKTREVLAKRSDNTEFPCRIGIQAIPGNSNHLVGFVRDVSSEKKAMELQIEKRAAEELLLNMLPTEIAIRLKHDPHHIADHFACATILFADIVGFTKMSNTMEPIQVVQFLNDLFSKFDNSIDKYKLNKVKTIGDCYMVTSIPGSNDPSLASAAVCHFALDMVVQLNEYNQEHPDRPLNIRIGVNAGPVVAGVVGTKRFLYDLWGDAVNVASRMESTGVPGKIQVTQSLIDSVPKEEFVFEKRGSVAVKGIGEMETFFLQERKITRATTYWSSLRKTVLAPNRSFAKRFQSLELLTNVAQIDDNDRNQTTNLEED